MHGFSLCVLFSPCGYSICDEEDSPVLPLYCEPIWSLGLFSWFPKIWKRKCRLPCADDVLLQQRVFTTLLEDCPSKVGLHRLIYSILRSQLCLFLTSNALRLASIAILFILNVIVIKQFVHCLSDQTVPYSTKKMYGCMSAFLLIPALSFFRVYVINISQFLACISGYRLMSATLFSSLKRLNNNIKSFDSTHGVHMVNFFTSDARGVFNLPVFGPPAFTGISMCLLICLYSLFTSGYKVLAGFFVIALALILDIVILKHVSRLKLKASKFADVRCRLIETCLTYSAVEIDAVRSNIEEARSKEWSLRRWALFLTSISAVLVASLPVLVPFFTLLPFTLSGAVLHDSDVVVLLTLWSSSRGQLSGVMSSLKSFTDSFVSLKRFLQIWNQDVESRGVYEQAPVSVESANCAGDDEEEIALFSSHASDLIEPNRQISYWQCLMLYVSAVGRFSRIKVALLLCLYISVYLCNFAVLHLERTWVQRYMAGEEAGGYAWAICGLLMCVALLGAAQAATLAWLCMEAARSMHEALMARLSERRNRRGDAAKTLLTLFSKDISELHVLVPPNLDRMLGAIFNVVAGMLTLSLLLKTYVVLLVALCIGFIVVFRIVAPIFSELKERESLAMETVLLQLSELCKLPSDASNKCKRVMLTGVAKSFEKRLVCSMLMTSGFRWLTIRVEALGCVFLAAVMAVYIADSSSSSALGFGEMLSMVLLSIGTLNVAMLNAIRLRNALVPVSRIFRASGANGPPLTL